MAHTSQTRSQPPTASSTPNHHVPHSAMQKLHLGKIILRCSARTATFHRWPHTECNQPCNQCHHQLSQLFGDSSEKVVLPCTTRGEAPEPSHTDLLLTPSSHAHILSRNFNLTQCTKMREPGCRRTPLRLGLLELVSVRIRLPGHTRTRRLCETHSPSAPGHTRTRHRARQIPETKLDQVTVRIRLSPLLQTHQNQNR